MSDAPDDGLAVGPRWRESGSAPAWTLIGTLGQPGRLDSPRALVDPAGLVGPEDGRWSLDWWVGADDRWHLPAREAAVRQRLVDHAPVVETAMRVPGGDVVHRAYGVRTADGGDAVVVEVANDTPVPVALALAVRPYSPSVEGHVGELRLGGTTVWIDGREAVVLPRPPNRTAASTAIEGDCADVVLSGDAGGDQDFAVRCPDGRAQAALVYPLPHTAVLRVLLPLDSAAASSFDPDRQPSAVQVATGWRGQVDAGLRVDLPAGRLAEAVEAARRSLLLAAGGLGPGPSSVLDRVAITGALDRWGFAHDAGVALAALASASDDLLLVPPSDRQDAAGAALVAVAEHVRLAGDDDLLDALRHHIAHTAGSIRRAAGGSRGRRRTKLTGLPPGAQPPWLAPGRYRRDDLWAVAGLQGAAELLERAGESTAAAAARADADSLWDTLPTALRDPSPPDGAGDGAALADLVAVSLGLLAPDHPTVVRLLDEVRAEADTAAGVRVPIRPDRCRPELTLALAAGELARGERTGLEHLDLVVGQASPTWAWPEEVEAATGAPAGGVAHHLPTTAAFLRVVRDLVVLDRPTGLTLLPVFPPTWAGQGLEVHGAPTRFGRLSYAIRWHGERPALLWELDPHPGIESVELQAPGLDPAWRGHGLSGDALLAPPRPA